MGQPWMKTRVVLVELKSLELSEASFRGAGEDAGV